MSFFRSTFLLGASLVGAGAIALVGAGAASAESGINLHRAMTACSTRDRQ